MPLVDLTQEELLLLRVRLSGAYTRTAPIGFGVPAVNSSLDAKLSKAQKSLQSDRTHSLRRLRHCNLRLAFASWLGRQ